MVNNLLFYNPPPIFSGVALRGGTDRMLRIVKSFFPASIKLHLTVEEDPSCPGQYHWMQESRVFFSCQVP